jgi:cytochrome c
VTIIAVLIAAVPHAAAEQQPVPDVFEPCASCHAYERDEAAQEGPPLWGVVGRRIASVDGFDYSPALKAIGGSWDRAKLDRFLKDPKAFAPGTLMNVGRVSDAADRAEVLDFLEALKADSPAAAADK